MKIDRLIGILSVLLQKEKMTAPELAERFEVSRRTINRDIEDLCKAGIPIQTSQGTGGGISIMEGYRLDRTILTSKDMQMILAGLRSLDSVSGSFQYYAPSGESERTVEPYFLVFRWSSWYLWGWCKDRKDFRMFKLNRMDRIQKTDESFECRNIAMPDLSNEKIFPGGIKVKVLFEPDQKWRLIEEFGPKCFTEYDDGRLLFTGDYTDLGNLITWLMTFGDKAEVIKPREAREAISQMVKRMMKIYKEDTTL